MNNWRGDLPDISAKKEALMFVQAKQDKVRDNDEHVLGTVLIGSVSKWRCKVWESTPSKPGHARMCTFCTNHPPKLSEIDLKVLQYIAQHDASCDTSQSPPVHRTTRRLM